jgi:hypothetical protein
VHSTLHLNIFHPTHDDLIMAGLIGLSERDRAPRHLQCRVIAAAIRALDASPAMARHLIHAEAADGSGW